ncbi:MAG: hypothetical protein K0S32_3640 [Bacteroidetes bacterium]|jgi:hypothetical protein|nr:hypothetical protein [Bacteroidota bacterium]
MLLNCTPNDLLFSTLGKKETYSDKHSLAKLYKPNVDYNLKDVLKGIPLEDLQKLVSTIKDGNKASDPDS